MATSLDTPLPVSLTPATAKVEEPDEGILSSSDNDPSSDEQVERELQDRLADQKKLDSRFTPNQLEYLNENKDAYRYAAGKQRREIAQATGDRFLKQVQNAGRDPSKKEIAALYNNVKQWYAQRARSRHGPMHWTINWTGRQVFYKENSGLVQETQKKLYELSTGKKATEVLDGEIDLDLVEEQESLGPSIDSTKAPKLFHFFQRAISAEWNALTKKQREEYEAKALVWREKGPSREERTRLAEKEAGRVLHQFADDVYRQMGVRIYYLVSYEDTSGDHIAFSLDFNNQIDNGVSFKQAERGYLERVDLENHWAGFVRRTLPEVKNEDEDAHHVPKKRGDPLPVECNAFGAPIIPDISTLPRTVKPHRHLPNLVRSIMRHDYACARNLPPNDLNSAPPWKEMVKNWRKFIAEEFWPSEWPVGDPGNLGVESCRTILRYWFQRQKNGEIPFQFHSYWTGANGWAPRELPEKAEDSDFTDKPAPKQRKRRGAPKKETKKASKRAQKPRGDATVSTTQATSATVPASEGAHVVPAVHDPSPPAHSPPISLSEAHPAADRGNDVLPQPSQPAAVALSWRKGKARAMTNQIESSPEVDSERETPMDSEGEAQPNRLRKGDTPTTRKLIGATQKWTLNTPSREGSTTSFKDTVVAPNHLSEKETSFAPGKKSVDEQGLSRVQDDTQDREENERKARENNHQEALLPAKLRAGVKRLKAKAASTITDAEPASEGLKGGSVTESNGRVGGNSLEAVPTIILNPISSETLDVEMVNEEDQECEGGGEQSEGLKGQQDKEPKDEETGNQETVQELGAQRGKGVDVGTSKPRRQPQEDRLLLAAAASYLPTSAKRDRKRNRLFEQVDAPVRRRK